MAQLSRVRTCGDEKTVECLELVGAALVFEQHTCGREGELEKLLIDLRGSARAIQGAYQT